MYSDIKGFEGHYTIGRHGRIWSKKSNKFLKGFVMQRGYQVIDLCINGVAKKYLIHRLVAQTYIPNPANLPQVNHIDGNKKNNRVENLEWCTNQQNRDHAIKSGIINLRGENGPMSKLTNFQANQLRILRKSGFTFKELGSLFGICSQAAHQICHRKTYK